MDPRVGTVLELIDRNLRSPLRVTVLAAAVELSASRLEHLFRVQTNMSIRAYVARRRLRMAARMLRRSHERVSSIAFAVGFNDVSNFNHAFKRAFGVSPLRYRRADRPPRENSRAAAGSTK
jgi:AraC family transcriptional regulator of arabinose operon